MVRFVVILQAKSRMMGSCIICYVYSWNISSHNELLGQFLRRFVCVRVFADLYVLHIHGKHLERFGGIIVYSYRNEKEINYLHCMVV